MRRAAAVLAVVVASTVLASPAAAQSAGVLGGDAGIYLVGGPPGATIVAQSRSVVSLTGEMVVEYEGDPATCAPAGRCGTSGTIVWRPERPAELYLSDVADRRRRSVLASYFPNGPFDIGSEVVVQARRQRASGGTARCTDATRSTEGLDATVAGRELVFGVHPQGTGPLESRCAGPLWADLRYVLPRPRLDLAAFRRRGGVADLRADQTFSAGGLRGTVRSSLVARMTRPRRQREDGGSVTREEGAAFRTTGWRVERVTGSVRLDVRGPEAASRCEPLDACGLTATMTITPRAGEGDVTTFATDRPVDGVRFGGAGGWRDPGTVLTTLTRPDAPEPCSDQAPLHSALLMLDESRGRVRASYDPFPGVRTRCGGPTFGPSQAGTARGTAARRDVLRSRRVTLRLTRGSFRIVSGFRVATHPDLTIELVRRR